MAPLAMRIPRLSFAHLDWHGLLLLSGVTNLSLLLALAVSQHDRLAWVLVLALGLGLGLSSMGRRGLSVGVLGLINIYIAVYTLSSAVTNIVYGEAVTAVAIPSALGTIALAGITGAGGLLLEQRREKRRGVVPPVIARVSGLFCVLTIGQRVDVNAAEGASG